jgi:hypothetical protein
VLPEGRLEDYSRGFLASLEEKPVSTAAPVVEKVTRTRTLTAAEVAGEPGGRKTPEFWDFIESMTPEMWAADYLLYILREDPKPSMYGGTNTLEKCPGYIAMPDGTQTRLSSREDIELAIKQKYGGKAFRLILKKGSERISEGKCVNEAPPRMPDADPQYGRHPLPNAQTTDAGVAAKAIDAMAAQQPEAVRLAMDVLRGASEIVMRQAKPNEAAATSQSSLIDQTVVKSLIDKALAAPAPPDMFAMFLKFKEIMAPPLPASNGVKDTLELIGTLKNSGLVAFGGSARTSLLDLGRELLPVVVTTAKEVMHEWRLGVEAQVRGVELSRGMNPQPPAPVAAVPPAIAPAAAVPPPAVPPAAQQTAPSGEPPFDWLAIKIVEIMKEPTYTIDEAVDETLSFLYRSHAPVVALLLDPPKINAQLSPGEQGLLQLFQHHPVLKQVPVNPRLVEFIKKFIAEATAAELERTAGASPKPTPPATQPA